MKYTVYATSPEGYTTRGPVSRSREEAIYRARLLGYKYYNKPIYTIIAIHPSGTITSQSL